MSHKEKFEGVIGKTIKESTPWWPEPKRTKQDSPNVVVILFDDLGFSQFGCYGSTIDTPNIDKLAAGGVRFSNFHTTRTPDFHGTSKDGLLVIDSNALAKHSVIRSDKKVPAGKCTVGAAFTWADNQGTITLLINGEECGSLPVPTTIRTHSTGMSIGRDALSPVTDDYQAPFPFQGKITRVEVTHKPYKSAEDRKKDEDARYQAEMSRQ